MQLPASAELAKRAIISPRKQFKPSPGDFGAWSFPRTPLPCPLPGSSWDFSLKLPHRTPPGPKSQEIPLLHPTSFFHRVLLYSKKCRKLRF